MATFLLALIALTMAVRQLRAQNQAREDQLLLRITDLLNSDDMRRRRREIFEAIDRNEPPDPDQLEYVTHKFQVACVLMKGSASLRRRILDEYSRLFIRMWTLAEGFVNARRERENQPWLWMELQQTSDAAKLVDLNRSKQFSKGKQLGPNQPKAASSD